MQYLKQYDLKNNLASLLIGILIGIGVGLIISHLLAKQPVLSNVSPKACTIGKNQYKDGEKFRMACNSCVCTNGQVACTEMACADSTDGEQTTGNACREDALVCPNNSSVGRSGPSCSFDACSYAVAKTQQWRTVTTNHVSLKIPKTWHDKTQLQNEGHITQTTISGPEGELMLSTGTGFGGACNNTWMKINIAHETLVGCYGQLPNGSWEIKQISKQISNDTWFDGRITVLPGAKNMDTVLSIMATVTIEN